MRTSYDYMSNDDGELQSCDNCYMVVPLHRFTFNGEEPHNYCELCASSYAPRKLAGDTQLGPTLAAIANILRKDIYALVEEVAQLRKEIV